MTSAATASGRAFRSKAAPAGPYSRCPGAASGREQPGTRAGSFRLGSARAAQTNGAPPDRPTGDPDFPAGNGFALCASSRPAVRDGAAPGRSRSPSLPVSTRRSTPTRLAAVLQPGRIGSGASPCCPEHPPRHPPVARHGNPDTLCDTIQGPSTPPRGRSAGPRPLTTALSPGNRCALIPANKPTVENTAGTSRIGTPDAIMSRRIAVAEHPESGGMLIAGQDAMKKPAQRTIGRTGFMEPA